MQSLDFKDLSKEEQEALLLAKEAGRHFHNNIGVSYVGAVLLTSSGKKYIGASIRRQSVSSNTCAERMAVDQAIFAGEEDYAILAIVGGNKKGDQENLIPPCGSCRQIVFEFYPDKNRKGEILISNSDFSLISKTSIHELLPLSYFAK